MVQLSAARPLQALGRELEEREKTTPGCPWNSFRCWVSTSPMGDGRQGLYQKTWTAMCSDSCRFPWPLAEVEGAFLLLLSPK